MTRLITDWIKDMEETALEWSSRLKEMTGMDYIDLAAECAGLSVDEIYYAAGRLKVAAIPITSGMGIIGSFAQSVAAIVSAMGFETFVTENTDVNGLYEAKLKGADICFMADDDRYIALNLNNGSIGDNNIATARGYAKLLEAMAEGLVGRNVADLVAEGRFSPSVSLEVIKQRKTVNLIQTIPGDIRVLVTGVPVFDENHEKIELIISTTKKIDEISRMLDTMENQKREISNLRNMAFDEAGFITGGEDSADIREKILKIAPLDVPVLITGETGTGKGVAAKTIHKFKFNDDESKPFVKINCSTIPENLIESELFGYEKGAFTGASDHGKQGKVEMAEGGTLFLDEIGELPASVQVKLLDFIQDGEFTRVGGTSPIKVKTRLVTATNRNLKKMCQKGVFRTDLFFRINVVNLEIPPLRERPSDLEVLTKHFLSNCNTKYGNTKRIHPDAMKHMQSYEWPGNVRELEHVVENLHIFTDGYNIRENDVRNVLYGTPDNGEKCGKDVNITCNGIIPLKEAKHMLEIQLVTEAYKESGSTYKAAKILQVDQSTVSKILKRARTKEE